MSVNRFVAFVMAVTMCAAACHPQTQPTLPDLHDGGITAVNTQVIGPPSIVVRPLDPDAGGLNLSNAGQNGEQITPMHTGDRAPHNGVLFNGPATAYVQVEFRAQAQRCVIDRQLDVAMAVARYNTDMQSMNLALDTQRRMDQILLTGRDADIASLLRINQQLQRASGPNIGNDLLWAGGGFLVGAALIGGLALGFALSHP